MCRSRQSGWKSFRDRIWQARTNGSPRGVCPGPARGADSIRGSALDADTDTVRRNPGLRLTRQGTGIVLLARSSEIKPSLLRSAQKNPSKRIVRRGSRSLCLPRNSRLVPLLLLVSQACRERLHHVVEAETAGLLAGRKFPERSEKLPDDLLRRHEQERAVESPLWVADPDLMRLLERIRAQVA